MEDDLSLSRKVFFPVLVLLPIPGPEPAAALHLAAMVTWFMVTRQTAPDIMLTLLTVLTLVSIIGLMEKFAGISRQIGHTSLKS